MDTDELQGMMVDALGALRDLGEVNARSHALLLSETERLWKDNAELRDDIHAVANRVETLTRAMMIDAAEVAQKIVNDANNETRTIVHRRPGDPLREVKNDE